MNDNDNYSKDIENSYDLAKRIAFLEEKNQSLKERIRSLSLDNRELAQLINALLEKTPFGIIIFDSQRRLVRLNKAAETILGYDRVKAIGKDCTHFFQCYNNTNSCPVLKSNFDFDRSETQCACPGNSDKTLLRSTVTSNNIGEEFIIEAFFDISEIKQAESAIIETGQAKDDFLAKMSHELRTPLNAIIGYSDLILSDLKDEEHGFKKEKKFIDAIFTSGKQMLGLVDQLLDIANIKSMKLKLRAEPINLRKFIGNIETLIQPQVEINNNRLHITYKDDLGEMVSDPFRLQQILVNLLINACKFTRNGEIYFEIESAENGYIQFRIRDTGIGMDAKQQQRVFQTFEQADNSRTRSYGGAGLGLSIVKELVLLMKGSIQLESMPDNGSTFTVTLPLYYET